MRAGGMQASSHPLRWPLRSRTTTALAASGLILLFFTISRRIWRGGGRKAQDPGGTLLNKKVKEKKDKVLECSNLENFLATSSEKEVLVGQSNKLEVQEQKPSLVQPIESESLTDEAKFIEEEYNSFEKGLEKGCDPKEIGNEHLLEADEECQSSNTVIVDRVDTVNLDAQPKISKEEELQIIVDHSISEVGQTNAVDINKEDVDHVSQESLAVSIIPDECSSVSRQEVASSVITDANNPVVEEVAVKEDLKACHSEIKATGKEAGKQCDLVDEEVESSTISALTVESVTKEEELQETLNSETVKLTRSKRSVSVSQVEGALEVIEEVVLNQPEVEEEMMLVNQVKSYSGSKSSAKSKGQKKGGKGRKEVHQVKSEGVKGDMEVKDIVRDNVENEGVGEVEDNPNKCEVSAGQVPMDATGIGSPSMSNFPDNRSEGSSCGDSGKGRSDVTTPGGLEEEEREVNFPRHFSPPCSTSGPEEEEEEEENGNEIVENGNLECNNGEAVVIEDSPAVLMDGSLVPVGIPVSLYHGIVPLAPPPSVYEFVIPQGLVGRLIGKHGSFVNLIKARTSANIFIKTHPETSKLKVCAIEGTDNEIQAALEMIREKFPQRRYSSMTLEQVFFLPLPPPSFTLIPDSLHLHLVEGVSNDVILSAMVSPSHYFLQQPTHPTYPTLAKLDMWMSVCYQDANAPLLPETVEAGIICAAPTMGGWYRAQIVAVEEQPSSMEDENAEEGELVKWCDIRFVDYGGYERLPSQSLRQIRSDFMTLPFQASECYLASVVPAPTSDENTTADGWSMEAYSLVEELTQAQVLRAQVAGHAHDGLPLVFLYAYSHSYGQVVQVNEELVRRGLAVWALPMVEVNQMIEESTSEEDHQTEEETESKAA